MVIKKQIKSSIIYDQEIWMYKVVLPWIIRYFDTVIYGFDWSKEVYSKEKISLGIDNMLIWITQVDWYKILCFIDLGDLSSNYFFVKSFDIINFWLENSKYYCLVYSDINWNILYETNLDTNNYKLIIKKNKICIENNIFNTTVFEKEFFLENTDSTTIQSIQKNKATDIIDLFIFRDYFSESSWGTEFQSFLKMINFWDNVYLTTSEYNKEFYPKLKVNISINWDIEWIDFWKIRKIFLTYFLENTLVYIIDNDILKQYFWNYFLDMSVENIDNLNLDFKLPDDIFSWSKQYNRFKKDLLILLYNYYLLNINLLEIRWLANSKSEDVYIKSTIIRWKITESSLEKNISLYENRLKEVLEIIKNKSS